MDTDSGSDDTGEHKADAESDTKTLEELYKLSSEGRLETKTPKCILLPRGWRNHTQDAGASTVYEWLGPIESWRLTKCPLPQE